MIHSLISTLFLLNLFTIPSFAFNANSKQNVAVYWGQSSGGSQQSLGEYCKSSDADIFLLSFLSDFPNMNLDLSNACSGMGDCSSVGQDIKSCQQQGKIVLLSLGGAAGQYGFSDDNEGEQFAQELWDTFGGGSGNQRPFGDAVVDGFDFDIENNNAKGYAALATALRNKFQGGNKQFYLSAAPQCYYPDASVGDLLNNAQVDFAFIQFYNNYCSVEGQFNWDTWENFAETSSPNKDIKLFLGLPGSVSAAGSGYVSDISTLKSTISKISSSSYFGGVSLWDASQAFSNNVGGQTYVSEIKNALGSVSDSGSDSGSGSGSGQSSSSAAPSASSSWSSSSSAAPSPSVAPTSSSSWISSSAAPSSGSSWISSSAAPSLSVAPTSSASTFAPSSGSSWSSSSTAAPSSSSAPAPSSSSTPAPSSSATPAPSSSSTPAPTQAAPSSSSSDSYPSSRSTTTLAPSPSSTSSSSSAHSLAVSLNQKYFNGYTDQGQCNSGDIACTQNGNFAICDNGSWVETECASGTTCFAYDSDDSVYAGCNFQSLKSNYLS
ncbi:hypothetical protein ZYGR_0N06210 [Zygosaccharomyces rouxii]|uniref:chitinase n=2 Tax=Zygosaccharomyces rouxii TaxID=4956 RepID=C5DWG1_ZYGRC|nr:uncharacterized protein ZYRO0D14564g [Zygosaccharomyces rouxii]KAH9201041.1 glycoside hydrolase superfamily [Zygosaccharomyces rouxii]GAV49214.1 hypothetical protein ZYGR_0N06210 [Zygosaccharomyces rouxii]CAR28130.1 ZYRO0D14564p [Zygosaccharomyces rouxii]